MLNFYEAMRGCYRKAFFPSEKEARKRAAKIVERGGPQMYPYGCSQCGQYHLTKNEHAKGKVI